MMTCKKDVEPYVFNAEIKVSDIRAKQVLVEAINDEEGFEKLSAIVYYSIDEKLDELKQYEMTYEDDRFKAYLTELQDGTRYYYKVVFHGKYNSVETEIDTFETEKIVLPAVTTMQVSDVTTTSAKCGGEVTSEGNGTVTARGVCWSTSQNPTVKDNKTTDGGGTGSFTSNLSSLVPQTTYYVRAYATNEAGTVYGEQKTFTTQKKAVSLPDVLKTTVSNVTSNTAVFGSSVFSDGGGTVSARGFCWSSTTETPTVTNSSYTTNGSGLGSFSADVTGLKASTQYYVRAYATNEAGTAYSEMLSFYTSVEEQPEIVLPAVTTNEITDITTNSATCGGNVTSDGNGTVTVRGVCWSTNPNPTIEDNKTTNGNGTGSFTSNLSNLVPQTTYYVRAYAINEAGTVYGEVKSFTTLEEEPEETISGTENGHDYVDLGLPSGLKWATCNVGASSPEEYGDYFAWGETTTKSEYTEENSLTYGKQMNDISGNLQYDAATANWGGDWRMPTYDELNELLNNCTWTWITQNGVNGYKVTSKKNGNSIFLPAAGYRNGASLYDAGDYSYYWSSAPYYNRYAYYLHFGSSIHNVNSSYRYNGRTVRPVFGGNFDGPEEQPEQPEIVLPTVTTSDVTDITTNSATCGGNVISDGNGTVTARGICWSISQNPTIEDNKTNDGSGTGSFASQIPDLVPNTQYYVRAYATNEKGTVYGELKSFVTLLGDEDENLGTNQTFNVNGVSFTMIAVEGGIFKMGAQSSSSSGDNYDSDASSRESPVHSVTLSSYYIGETEVTQELWEAVMGSNPSYYSGYPQRPVEYVSWDDCQEFITKLNNLTGKNFRLPTEAEWEYAARGGNKSKGYKYSGSNTIDDVAWYTSNSSSQTHDVKTKQANELGIYDMSGNVYEWCQDWYGSYSSGSQTNPTGPSSGSDRVFRGSSCSNFAKLCRVSYREYFNPDFSSSGLGLRLSLSQD